jgi:hypothetical protein
LYSFNFPDPNLKAAIDVLRDPFLDLIWNFAFPDDKNLNADDFLERIT